MTEKIITNEALARELTHAAYKRAEQAMCLTKNGKPFATYWAAKAARKRLGLDETHVITGWKINGASGEVLIERPAWERFVEAINEIKTSARAIRSSKAASDELIDSFQLEWMETMQAGVKP